jgi:hypothetical protein
MTPTIDNNEFHEYNIVDKNVIIDRIKSLAIALSKKAGNNLRIEIDTNGKVESSKVRITEFL